MFSSLAVLHFTYCTLPAVLSPLSEDQISDLRSRGSEKYAENFHGSELGRKCLCPRKSRNTSSQILGRKMRSKSCGTRGPASPVGSR
ncbi:hypothetical protein DPMN_057156 [Dreissena polymorpha]|uniref:Secreted protein n=1 Tax=Dreissena polymorpha TaxID=45954 RepID=A0A9D4CVY9_DREPO|nr:hypothetical protein DPMN_057156 [Dreissena polymorpha]